MMIKNQQDIGYVFPRYGLPIIAPPKPGGGYTKQEWENRTDEYANAVHSIILPPDLDPQDLVLLNAALANIYSIARIEAATIQADYEYYKDILKKQESGLYNTIKRQLESDPARTKAPLDAEVKSGVVEHLRKVTYANTGQSIYDLYYSSQYAHTFMQGIMDILKYKSSQLITNSAAMKILLPQHYNNMT